MSPSKYNTNLLWLGPSTSSPLKDSTDPWLPQVASAGGARLFFTYFDICEPWRATLVFFYKHVNRQMNTVSCWANKPFYRL